MSYLDLTDEWIPELFAIITELNKFTPSAVSLREQRAREQADRTITAFSERFTEVGYFPDDNEWLVFALLPQLPEWPADLALWLVNEQRELIASWTKGNRGGTVIKNQVTLIQMNNGDYAAVSNTTQSVNDPEALFQLILSLLPAGLRLTGKFFSNTAEEIATLREQITALVRAERAKVFDALLADVAEIKNGSDDRHPNLFLPFWQVQPTDRSPVLNRLLALNPEISPERFEALLEHVPLSGTQSDAFLEKGELPEPFIDALQESVEEWSKDKGLDGIFHSRTYSPDADVLAQEFGADLLRERFGYELIITEPWQAAYEPSGPDDTAIVLTHDGYGNYGLRDLHNGGANSFNGGTDSFYRAIGLALQPHQRLGVGMQSEFDVAGLRTTLGNLAAAANGGWFDPKKSIEVKDDLLPEWLKNASKADKLVWNQALEDYRQALVEAQSPDVLDISQYGSPEHLRRYAKTEIEQRLRAEVGVTTSSDDITVVTTESTWTGSGEPPPDLEYGGSQQVGGGEWEHSHTQRSLTQLCLDNLRLEDSEFWLTAQFFDGNNRPITALNRNYVHGLIRDLNVGDSYAKFLRQKLLTSDFGQWSRDCYAQVMATQMRLDAVEAKMIGDLSDRVDREYQWLRAVLDHPVDDGNRPLVEGHRIQVQTLMLKHVSPWGPLRSWEAPLNGVLLIAPEASQSVDVMVIYTPSAPDGIRFRKYSSKKEITRNLLANSNLWDYLESRAPVGFEIKVREGLINAEGFTEVKEQSPITADLYRTHYKTEVEKVIAQIDAQTTSTSEANWKTAWNIASTLGELALEFAPFKVALPIAAARSLYALSQGAVTVGKGDGTAGVHFTQAVLLLTDGLPGVKKTKVKPRVSPNIEPGYALRATPDGLQLRTDGLFNGVYEKVDANGHSSFYAKDAGRTFAIRYDSSDARWRVINGRNPRSYYQMPVLLDGQGRWSHAPVTRGGSGRAGKGAKKAMKAKKAAEEAAARGDPAPSTSTNGVSTGIGRARLDVDEFFEDTKFLDTATSVTGTTEAQFTKSVKRAADMYEGRSKNTAHSSVDGYVSVDLLGLGVKGSTGRGKWRLLLDDPENGVRKVHGIWDHRQTYKRGGATNRPDS